MKGKEISVKALNENAKKLFAKTEPPFHTIQLV
jgi:hypothetical protein